MLATRTTCNSLHNNVYASHNSTIATFWKRVGHVEGYNVGMKRSNSVSYMPEYDAWNNAKQRCGDVNHPSWKNYGGRGIKVCEEWRNDFKAFYEHIGPKPTRDHTLDRIDNGKGYEPGNVRWTDCKTQARNTRSNRIVEYQGVRMTVAEACEKIGIRDNLIHGRMHNGFDFETAVAMPLRKRGKKQWVEYQGERVSVGQLEKRLGFAKDSLRQRFIRGWSLERAVSELPRKCPRRHDSIMDQGDSPI